MMNNKIELKPCPFCGSEAHVVQISTCFSQNPTTIRNSYIISCSSGCCETKECEDEIIRSIEGIEIKHDGVKEAIEAWNRRTTDDE